MVVPRQHELVPWKVSVWECDENQGGKCGYTPTYRHFLAVRFLLVKFEGASDRIGYIHNVPVLEVSIS